MIFDAILALLSVLHSRLRIVLFSLLLHLAAFLRDSLLLLDTLQHLSSALAVLIWTNFRKRIFYLSQCNPFQCFFLTLRFEAFNELVWRPRAFTVLNADVVGPRARCLVDRVVIQAPRWDVAHRLGSLTHLLLATGLVILQFMGIFLLKYVRTDCLAFELGQAWLI